MRNLLLAGVLLGPLFYVVVVAQMATRTGFTFTRHPISLLALGDWGWVQTANFVVAGLLGVALAAALFTLGAEPASLAAAVLILVFGAGIIIAGLFPADPSMGFPPGAPDGQPAALSRRAQLHGLGFMVSFSALTLAILAFAILFWSGDRAVSLGCIVIALSIPAIIAAGMSRIEWASTAFFTAGLVAFGWLAFVSFLLWKGN